MSHAKRFGTQTLLPVLAVALVACAVAFVAALPATAYAQDSQPMYRLYNPNSGEHFYTANEVERDNAKNAGWDYEGVGWVAPVSSQTPVYRVYNPNGGDHHYTTNVGERDSLVSGGWKDEGIGWYSDGTVPVYRQYNPNEFSCNHNYTTSAGEGASLVAAGWKDEGVGWYAVAEGYAANQKPLAGYEGDILTMEDDPAYASIEGVMNLQGVGSGYHAKIDVSSESGSVASFGIQYEKDISKAYPAASNSTVFLAENVMSHATEAGLTGKEYLYLKKAELAQDYKVRISWYKDTNELKFYVDDQEIGSTVTTMTPKFIFAVEGSVAHDGDQINAAVRDVRVKVGENISDYGVQGVWNDSFDYFGLDGTVTKQGTVVAEGPFGTDRNTTCGVDIMFRGTANIPGINPVTKTPWDWDTCFSAVEPSTGTIGHPLSAMVNIAQKNYGR